jgi:hypothetical protein
VTITTCVIHVQRVLQINNSTNKSHGLGKAYKLHLVDGKARCLHTHTNQSESVGKGLLDRQKEKIIL